MSMILYLFNGIICSGICYYLCTLPTLQLKGLRITLLGLFLSLSVYQLGWACWIIFTDTGVPVDSIGWYIINIPFSLALINLITYLKNIK